MHYSNKCFICCVSKGIFYDDYQIYLDEEVFEVFVIQNKLID